MIAVALHHRDLALEMRLKPFGAKGKRRERIADAVRLKVRLIHHVDADLVAEIVEFVRLRTVRIADVVEIALLDKLDILPQTPCRTVVPVDRVHLGTVYALEFDGLAVDEKRAVARILRLGYLDFAETEIEGYPFRDERVEIRDLRAPELRSAHAPFLVGHFFKFYLRPALFVNLKLRRTVGRERKDPVSFVNALLLGMRLEPDVFQMVFFQAVHANGSYDAGKAEHILTFEIRAVAVAVDLHGDGVASALEIFRHVVDRRRTAVFGKADVRPVYPEIVERLYALKADENLVFEPFGGNVEVAAVAADGVVLVTESPVFRNVVADYVRRAVAVRRASRRERVGRVDVDRNAETFARPADSARLPRTRHGHFRPRRNIVLRFLETDGSLRRPSRPVETPRLDARKIYRVRRRPQSRNRFLAERQPRRILPFSAVGSGNQSSQKRYMKRHLEILLYFFTDNVSRNVKRNATGS